MKRVLVVDDTKNIRVLLAACLEMEGFEVLTAVDGKTALEIFNTEKLDLAFLDIKMPQLSGTEVLRSIRESGINTPVIIMTAFATIKNAIECTKLGAVLYLQKPFTAEKIRAVLKEVEETANNPIPDNPQNYLKRIEYMIQTGQYEDAICLLKQALADEPSNASLYHLFSKVYEAMGNKELSIKFLNTYEIFKVK